MMMQGESESFVDDDLIYSKEQEEKKSASNINFEFEFNNNNNNNNYHNDIDNQDFDMRKSASSDFINKVQQFQRGQSAQNLQAAPVADPEFDFALASRRNRILHEIEEKDLQVAKELQQQYGALSEEELRQQELNRLRKEEEDFLLAQKIAQDLDSESRQREEQDAKLALQLAENMRLEAEEAKRAKANARSSHARSKSPSRASVHARPVEDDESIAQQMAEDERKLSFLKQQEQEVKDRQLAAVLAAEEAETRNSKPKQYDHVEQHNRQMNMMKANYGDLGAPASKPAVKAPMEAIAALSVIAGSPRSSSRSKPDIRASAPVPSVANLPMPKNIREEDRALYEEELFDAPPADAYVKPDPNAPRKDYSNLHSAMDAIIADEKAMLLAAESAQHESIKEDFFHQKMFILMQLPLEEQKRYHTAPKMLSPRKIDKMKKKEEEDRQKLEKERLKREKEFERVREKERLKMEKEREKQEKDRQKREKELNKSQKSRSFFGLGKSPSQQQQQQLQQQQQPPPPAGAAVLKDVHGEAAGHGGDEGLDPDYLLALKLQRELNGGQP